MPVLASKRIRGEAELLDQATKQLLHAVKTKAAKSGKPLHPAKLRKEGYSERFIARVEEA